VLFDLAVHVIRGWLFLEHQLQSHHDDYHPPSGNYGCHDLNVSSNHEGDGGNGWIFNLFKPSRDTGLTSEDTLACQVEQIGPCQRALEDY